MFLLFFYCAVEIYQCLFPVLNGAFQIVQLLKVIFVRSLGLEGLNFETASPSSFLISPDILNFTPVRVEGTVFLQLELILCLHCLVKAAETELHFSPFHSISMVD